MERMCLIQRGGRIKVVVVCRKLRGNDSIEKENGSCL